MSNELADRNMITTTQTKTGYTFTIKPNISTIWMSQETLSTFFNVPRKTIISELATILKPAY